MRTGAGHHLDTDGAGDFAALGFFLVIALLLWPGLFGALSFAALKAGTDLISKTIPHLALIRGQ